MTVPAVLVLLLAVAVWVVVGIRALLLGRERVTVVAAFMVLVLCYGLAGIAWSAVAA